MKVTIALLAIVFLVCAAVMPAFAAKKSFKEASEDAGRATVNYPANVVTESVDVVGKAVKGTGETIVGTVQATGETLTGKPEKASEIITTPVEGTVKTAGEAAYGTVVMPVKAGEKTAEQSQ
ncbi:MAG: hypothetical protein U9R44_01835 [Candidatus Omnitrophota bacterium]|nr:hypothetical protein [Candidatus Omnitrophota bacterium]